MFRTKMYDPVIFDVLKVNSVDFAKQITLIDVKLLQAISTEELASFGWNGKNKRVDSPNMMHLTDRFNMICFWCQREILLRCSYMKRARCIEHFIVIAKHLMSLNNLHSTFAILSALKSEPIYRLAKTWNNVARHSLAVLDKLSALFNSERNWNQLREYMSTTCLPCIPYLGLYLTDMCFILQGSKANKLTKASADQKLDEILRAISWMQNSRYDFVHVPCLQQYLLAFKFHHEFTDFMEEAMYRESLLCEPNGCSDVQGTVCNDSVDTSSLARKFATISCSISSNMCGKGTQSHLKTVPLKQHKISRNIPVHMLGKQTIISSLLRSRTNRTVKSNSKFYCSLDSEFIDPAKDDDSDSYMSRKISYPYLIRKLDKLHSRNYSNLRKAAEVFDHVQLQDSGYIFCDYEGEVKRITVRDHGNKRVKVHHIQKYYLELQANRLLQFQRKLVHFQSGNMRNFYNEKANEQMVLGKNHWMVKNCEKVDGCTFELHHPPTGRIYRYICLSQSTAREWYSLLLMASKANIAAPSSNFISFD